MHTLSHAPRRPSSRATAWWRAAAISVAGLALLAACGDDDASSETIAAPAAAPAAPSATAAAETSLGTVLVDAAGMTLYAFTNDTAGEPTCVEACAGAWPPSLVTGEPTFGDLDAALFSTVENPEGTQLKVAEYPLYTFAGDAAPGDVTGQGSGGVWFAVHADGTLVD